jgi:hypothetical protein
MEIIGGFDDVELIGASFSGWEPRHPRGIVTCRMDRLGIVT